ncbi:LacI family DNA-binding transcriptional regulator [Arthrobacter sp. B2a2-09]|uniref:LacI family DNA-binding transcriptional regulator n=1 Tax=Arthrobacter sp. B2a2-09 TaxID=2952822 RepID=UPI0022CDAFD0|nr:LacI family DNA-binding transcriptional regulator [Arthrobacter sp. B2a2-09]MCZ9881782.1 LacI family transcriptional regulator [Arthrobacter sp. B2a2-09]
MSVYQRRFINKGKVGKIDTAQPTALGTERRATMADVAAHVGVSRQLVGLVFRNEQGVAAQTRKRILDAADELGYRPNTAARSLRSASTKTIGVIFHPNESAPLEIIEWIYEYGRRAGYTVIVSTASPTRAERRAIDELIGYRCEALILISPREDPDVLRSATGHTPVVVVGRDMPNSEFDVVRSRGDEGIETIVRYLASLGHTDMIYVHGSDMFDSELRLAGYRRAMSSLGLGEQVLELPGDYTEESGASAARVLLERELLPTAIVCNNDQAALGLSHVLQQAGVLIPEHVSLTGYDDSRIASLSFLDLTTARQDPEEIGAAAIRAAVARITGDASKPTQSWTSAPLVVRGSTAVPPK